MYTVDVCIYIYVYDMTCDIDYIHITICCHQIQFQSRSPIYLVWFYDSFLRGKSLDP